MDFLDHGVESVHNGFTEPLFVALAISLVGFVGYLVWYLRSA
ncbi:MAG: hypothetical protein ACPHK8_03680 [Thermoplasmatota archaeon]